MDSTIRKIIIIQFPYTSDYYWKLFSFHIIPTMVRVPYASSVVYRGFNPCRAKSKTTMVLFTASQSSTQEIAKLVAWNLDNVSEWRTCLPAEYCFSELAPQKSN